MKRGLRSVVKGVAFGLPLPEVGLLLDFVLHEALCDERQRLFEVIDEGIETEMERYGRKRCGRARLMVLPTFHAEMPNQAKPV